MPINTSEILTLVTQVCEEEKLRVPVKESLKGGAIAFATTTVGGLLAGPVGLAVGGTVGGLTAAFLSHGKFKSVADVIRNDLTVAQREQLSNSVRNIIYGIGPEDVLVLTAYALQPAVKERVLQEVFSFFRSQLQLQIVD
ncbi:protein C19orf12 homolog isoform X2 [Eriocheir sinensis]|uniref:protein C19orf12 homolog isoform X2 n=1 Tax=Eriocheir sinensis TaxID=95602 RepID=UPI0021C6E8B0|nr:protein C19orf12 homolog isoform X2 [Eriocheir sinensis]XP_050726912.1 protein C19orf12 homolog isoform X2 [Eriocheir sinensis]